MLNLNITSETARLKAVVLGIATSNGATPTLDQAYDPKSKEHIIKGTYPLESDMINEIEEVAKVLEKHQVKVYRPHCIQNYNQIFSRDIGFVIEDKFIKANILPDRDQEIEAIQYILDQIPDENIIKLPEDCHIEGGDVMPHNNYIFIGTYSAADYPNYITARTNNLAVEALQGLFPHKQVKAFDLRKDNQNPKENALHLDCCFQPVGSNYAIIHKNGFLNEADYNWLVNYFGEENVFEIDKDEMYDMTSNIFSIAEDLVISDASFTRLNNWLENRGIKVETVNYREIAKQEGLLRCSTLPLIRE